MWICRALLLAAACWMGMSSFAQAQTASMPEADEASAILACFHAGQTAIGDLHACARAWVTPKALLLCALQNTAAGQADHIACPFISDNAEGQAVFDVLLVQQHLTRASNLSLDASNLPNLPDASAIEACNTTSATRQDFMACTQNAMSGRQIESLLSCIRNSRSDDARTLCLAESAPAEAGLAAAVKCLNGQSTTPAEFLACVAPDRKTTVEKVMGCAAQAGASAAALADCLMPGTSVAEKTLAACLSQSQNDGRNVVDCFGHFWSPFGRADQAAACLSDPRNGWETCAQELIGVTGVSEALETCAGVRRKGLVACLFDKMPDLHPTAAAYRCLIYGGEGRSLVSDCTGDLIKDDKIRQTLACVTGANNNRTALAICAAGSVLPSKEAHKVNCAATTQGAPVAFALCAAAPATNEDWRISAACALTSGGDAKVYARCMAAPFALAELGKCFRGHFGSDCFGSANSITELLGDAK